MSLYKRGQIWHYDFMVAGQRFRGSTKQSTETKARKVESLLLAEAAQRGKPAIFRRAPLLREFALRFTHWLDHSNLEAGSRRYYRVGWAMIQRTQLPAMKLTDITSDEAWAAGFTGSASAVNNALRTLRRMLGKAEEWGVIVAAPRIRLAKEFGRSKLIDEQAERQLLAHGCQPFCDVLILIQDAGLRPAEIFRMRIENIDWQRKRYFVPYGKSYKARRHVPLSERTINLLLLRAGKRKEGWVFPSKRARSGHIETVEKQFLAARKAAGIHQDIVLYCARHTFGTYALEETGNLAAVMKVMGHEDVKTTMRYQHPETDGIRDIINQRNLERHNSRHNAEWVQ